MPKNYAFDKLYKIYDNKEKIMEKDMKVNKEWLEVYNKKKSIMCPENSLEKYFTDRKIAG